MNYFKMLSLVFGFAALLKPFYMHVIPWDENKFIAKTYSKERPAWIVPVAIIGLLLIAYTWYQHLTTDVPYSIIITLIFSLTALKGLILLFDYQKFYGWVAKMLDRNQKEIVLVDVAAGLIGLIMVLLGLFLY